MTRLRSLNRTALVPVLAASLWVFAACGDDETGDPDASVAIDAADGVDAAENPDADPPDAAIPPAAPTVTAPATSDPVFSPITVEGGAEANAQVDVVVIDNGIDVGTATANANASGDFSLRVYYTNADATDPLTVRVTQTARGLVSDPTDVAVVQLAVFELSGQIDQANDGSQLLGTLVAIRAYDSATEDLDFAVEVEIAATDGLILAPTAYSLELPNGTWTVRAFRDSRGPSSSAADGHPTMRFDAQVAGTPVTIDNANETGNDITLVNTAASDTCHSLQVLTRHESFEARPPEDAADNPGLGLCEGFYMQVGASTDLADAPRVRLPNGDDVTLINDGGCSEEVADNTSQSYDDDDTDDRFHKGIPDPDGALAGDYTLHCRDTNLDFIHNEVDTIHTVLKLERRIPSITPTGAAHVTDLTPTITWNAVPDADIYDVLVFGRTYDNWSDATRRTALTTYTVGDSYPLDDDEPHLLWIWAEAMDPIKTLDIDALAFGTMNIFVTDVDSDNVITISGDIDDQSGATGGYLGVAWGYDMSNWFGPQSTISLPSTATSYTMTVLEDPSCPLDPGEEEGTAFVLIDVDDSGEWYSSGNSAYSDGSAALEACADIDLDVSYRPAVELIAPADGATGTGNTPDMQWSDYAATYLAATGNALSTELSAWSYVWLAFEAGGGPPVMLWGLPSSATNYDMASPPTGNNKYDAAQLMGGASATDFSATTDWSWQVMVADCDYDEYLSGTASAYTDCMLELVNAEGRTAFAQSQEADFTTD